MLRSPVRFADGQVKPLVQRVFALVFFHQTLLLLPQENPLLACQPSTEVVLGTFSDVAVVVLVVRRVLVLCRVFRSTTSGLLRLFLLLKSGGHGSWLWFGCCAALRAWQWRA